MRSNNAVAGQASGHQGAAGDNGSCQHLELLSHRVEETSWLPVRSLLPADSPRFDGEDLDHVRMLAAVETRLPPILVHRSTMRVIDGMHRLAATKLRNEETIEARLFDGTEQEAFVLAVKTNVAHGRPLSLSERSRAAERIMVAYPTWSDRAIALSVGVSARLVANLRRRLEANVESFDATRSRVGRDGRMRPIDNVEGRMKAAEVIRKFPHASLREIGHQAGVSPATAGDVRKRIMRGEDPVPGRDRTERKAARATPARALDLPQEQDIQAILQGLKGDPSLRFTEEGRGLLRWIMPKVLRAEEWQEVSSALPPHATYLLAEVARRCADEWREIATDLDQRTRRAG